MYSLLLYRNDDILIYIVQGYIFYNNIGIGLVLKFVIGTYNGSEDVVFDIFVIFCTRVFNINILKTV